MKLSTSLLVASLAATSAPTWAFSTSKSSARSSSTQLAAGGDGEDIRVVVTGLGVVNGCGVGHEEFFDACVEGKSSIDKVQRFDVSNMPCQIASEVPDEMFDPGHFFGNAKNVKSNDRFTHFAVAAAKQALKDGGLGDTPETLEDPAKIGVMVGTAFGGMETFEKQTLKLAKKPERPKVNI
jgi:3-oxoacyl-[acyl-carrier-protein] synthase II